MKCRVCGNEKNNSLYSVKEMRMGLRTPFNYFECSECGCLQICEIPEDISKYYPSDYGPHNVNEGFANKLYDLLLVYIVFRNSVIGYLLYKFVNYNKNYVIFYEVLHTFKKRNLLKKESKILDVGCADGHFLSILKKGGCKNLTGIDLFIDEEKFKKDIALIKTSLDEYEPDLKFDFIFLNHSFEHMDDPVENLARLKELLEEDGFLFISIPVKSDLIWKDYGVNWLGVDAPRHIVLYTPEGFEILCEKVGLKIEEVIYDSKAASFFLSECFKRDIAIDEENDAYVLSKKEMDLLEVKASKRNQIKQGDRAIFILTRNK